MYVIGSISNPLVFYLSGVVLIQVVYNKEKKVALIEEWSKWYQYVSIPHCFDIKIKEVMPECHHSTSVVLDKQLAAELWRGSSGSMGRTCGEATRARGHLDYKYWELVKATGEFGFGWILKTFSRPLGIHSCLGKALHADSGDEPFRGLEKEVNSLPTQASLFPSNVLSE